MSSGSVVGLHPAAKRLLAMSLAFLVHPVFAQGNLVVNEIMYDPLSGQPEWFELYNGGADQVDLRDWAFSDASSDKRYIVSEETMILLPDQFAVIAEDSSIVDVFPGMEGLLCVPDRFPALNNDGDVVVVFDPNDTAVDGVEYRPEWGGGDGISLERIQPSIPSSDSANWSSCVALEGGTPGIRNSIFVEVLLSEAEVSVFPNPFSPDADGFEDATVISYHLPTRTSNVNLRIYDVRGRLIRTLRGAFPSGASGSVIWDGKDDAGSTARMGIYVVYLEGLGSVEGVLAMCKTTVVLARK